MIGFYIFFLASLLYNRDPIKISESACCVSMDPIFHIYIIVYSAVCKPQRLVFTLTMKLEMRKANLTLPV